MWDEDDLMHLLCERLRASEDLIKTLGAEGCSDEELFYLVFPDKVDDAERKPTTWNWVQSRIRDGNDVKPPRNLIDLAKLATEEQIRAENREAREFKRGEPLVMSAAIKAAHRRLSAQRVEDTLLAEVTDAQRDYILKFRRSKAEHDKSSLGTLLGLEGEDLAEVIRQLVEAGFLEELRATWKVPMLYRDGLDIRQGKAF